MDEYKALQIGALLHDIGKFVQRAKNIRKKHHWEIGYEFLKDKFEEGFLKDLTDEEKNLILDIVKNHHNDSKKTGLIGIVRLADWLSSGEREKPPNESDENLESIENKEYQALLSIFESVMILKELEEDLKTNDLSSYYYEIYKNGFKYDLKPLNIKDAIFTNKPYPNIDYSEYLTNFEKELSQFFKEDVTFEELLQLIQQYFWCIPSATLWISKDELKGSIPDVSLYDHSKITCAIACCLYRLYKNKRITDEDIKKYLNGKNWEDKWEDKIFSLIHGDISGIQDFIFSIVSKGATKSLKGRSFFLDFLTEYFAKYICKELNLSISNIIFCGGGHFYILSYKIDDEGINEFEQEINDILFEMFKNKLYLNLAKVDVSLNDFKNFSNKWKEVSDETIKKKLKRFSYKLKEIFEPIDKGYEDRCSICKKELKDKENSYYLEGHREICEYCASFIALTDILKQSNNEIDFTKKFKTTVKKAKNKDTNKFEEFSFKELPIISELDKTFKLLDNKEYFLDKYYLPDNNGELVIPYKIWCIAFPTENGENEKIKIKDFSILGEQAKERTGTNKIATLKMDVDNLGVIFTQGFGINTRYASLSRISTLSFFLTLFFTGYIPYLIKTKYKDDVYLVYAGGDDTLISGAWDKVWELAKEIRKKFKEFVCYNPFITLSAGIILTNPKFEYKKTVNLAEEELEKSKENIIYENKDKNIKLEKNSLTIFGCPMNWDLEVYYDENFWEKFNKIKEVNNNILDKYYKDILDFVKYNDTNLIKKYNEDILEEKFENAIKKTEKKRILHIAQIVGLRLENVVKENNKEIIVNIPYYWRILYYLHRNYKDNKTNELNKDVKFLKEYIKEKTKKVIFSKLEPEKKINLNFNDLKVSAKIVELRNRGG
ncbi:type III-A CRISPR-associated protein Cas10/Csm1 [Methanocaldococcus indicus]|uniref:type III-A CRISPR-associated protein Cas10/Csm1 n=1 Tax=Methanocaldococcus indicus TaxID=213231 RepID=UPI003C6D430D